jgi:hypothetical protein
MKTLSLLPLVLVASVAVAADDFDGKSPMTCTPEHGHDCLPTATACKALAPEAGKDLQIDVAKMSIKAPYRKTNLPIESLKNNQKSLILQGTDLEFVWAANIQRATGKITITIADKEGAYVMFGQCKLTAKAAP